MHLALWKKDAGAFRNWRFRFAGPHAAFTSQNKQHFFVIVKMIGRAARRNRTNELCHLSAADFIIDEEAIPAIGGWLCSLIRESHDRQSIGSD